MNYRNAKYIDTTRIDCEINHPDYGWIPYTLDPLDTDSTVDNAALMASMQLKGDVVSYVAPTQKELDTKAAAQVRADRDQLLLEVDAVVSNPLRWSDMTAGKQGEWADYRTALLALTDQSGFPHSVAWPEKP